MANAGHSHCFQTESGSARRGDHFPVVTHQRLRVRVPRTVAGVRPAPGVEGVQLRSLSRVATPANEETLLDYAAHATAQQVDDHCRQLRNVQREISTGDAERLHRQRYLSISSHADGTVTISVELPAETGELVRKALEMAQSEMETDGINSDEVPSVGKESMFAKQADALLHVVQPALKRALLARDKCCRFPGCSHKKWLDAHHVEHWADGGETSLENTVLLCSKHHRLLHEGNFQIKPGPDGEWHFQNHLRS